MTKDFFYVAFAIFLAAEIVFVLAAVAWEALKKRRKRAECPWSAAMGAAIGGYVDSGPVESLGREKAP